jgi:hypothetical protein
MRTLLEALEDKARILAQPWTVGPDAYQYALDVKQPWIAEISPMQYAMMGKAAKAAYDKKRSGEWEASGKAKDAWRAAVVAAFAAGQFAKDDPTVHPDARREVLHARMAADQATAAQGKAEKDKANGITRSDQLKVGDRVWDPMYRGYVVVKKISAKSVQVEHKFGVGKITMSDKVPQLMWKSPADLHGQG